jgi:hypothetical protein
MRKTVVKLALAATVLTYYDPVELVIYLDTPPGGTSIDSIVAEAVCPYVRADQLPLPVPYTVRMLQKSGESQRYVPAPAPVAKGLLSKCPATLDQRDAQGGSRRAR